MSNRLAESVAMTFNLLQVEQTLLAPVGSMIGERILVSNSLRHSVHLPGAAFSSHHKNSRLR